MKAGATRMCVLPFTTPSVEPDGTVRLCSAASTYAYLNQTNMGNYRETGLAAVWTNSRFREIRESLLTGVGLKPFCEACEYQHEGPPWLLQFHLALYGHNQTGAEVFLPIIERYRDRYEEYCRIASPLGLWTEMMPATPKDEFGWIYRVKPLVRPVVRFEAEGQWAEAALAIAPFDLERLVQSDECRVIIRANASGVPSAAALNLRVSLEDREGKLAYYFPRFNQPEGLLSFAARSLKSEEATALPRKTSRMRVGGFGPSGSSLTIESVEIFVGQDVAEACPELADSVLRQREEQLRSVQARLDELDRRVEPLRKVFRLLPGWLRDALKGLV